MFKMCFPITVGTLVPPHLNVLIEKTATIEASVPIEWRTVVSRRNYLHLFRSPHVKVYRLDFRDVGAHAPVDARTTNAYEDTAKSQRGYISKACPVQL